MALLPRAEFASGITLAIAGALKIYPALFLIFFLWKKQWRAAAGVVAGVIGAAALSVFLFGRNAFVLYATEILPAGLRGESLDPYSTGWNSLTALLRRLLIYEPELNPSPVAQWPHLGRRAATTGPCCHSGWISLRDRHPFW